MTSERPGLDEFERRLELLRDGGEADPGELDPDLSEALRIGSEALGRLSLDLRRGGAEMRVRGWFTRAAAVLVSPGFGASDDDPVRLAIVSIEKLAQRIARFADLGPRPGKAAATQAPLSRASIERLLDGGASGDRDAAAALLQASSEALPGWAEALSDPELTGWALRVEGVGETAASLPPRQLEALDVPGSRIWLVVPDQDGGDPMLLATTPRLVWATLTSLVPCWDV